MKERLFLGIKLTTRLERELADCPSMYHFYFKDDDPAYLQKVVVGEDKYLGKVLEQGIDFESLANVVANVRSIVAKIAPRYKLSEANIRFFAQTLVG